MINNGVSYRRFAITGARRKAEFTGILVVRNSTAHRESRRETHEAPHNDAQEPPLLLSLKTMERGETP